MNPRMLSSSCELRQLMIENFIHRLTSTYNEQGESENFTTLCLDFTMKFQRFNQHCCRLQRFHRNLNCTSAATLIIKLQSITFRLLREFFLKTEHDRRKLLSIIKLMKRCVLKLQKFSYTQEKNFWDQYRNQYSRHSSNHLTFPTLLDERNLLKLHLSNENAE